jgi:hypothetical protein
MRRSTRLHTYNSKEAEFTDAFETMLNEEATARVEAVEATAKAEEDAKLLAEGKRNRNSARIDGLVSQKDHKQFIAAAVSMAAQMEEEGFDVEDFIDYLVEEINDAIA